MKLSHLKTIIKESIKNLINEQGSGFQTTIKCPFGFTVTQLNSNYQNIGGFMPHIAIYTLPIGASIEYTCVPKKLDGELPK